MADPSSNCDPSSQTLRYQLAKTRDAAQRILQQAKSRWDLQCPINTLLLQELSIFQDSIRELEAQILDNHLRHEEVPELASESISRQLNLVKKHMFETLHVLEAVKNMKRHGQEGAINALFLKEHYLGDGQLSEDRFLRIGESVRELMHNIFAGSDLDRKGLFDRFHQHIPEITDTFTSIESQLRPRYIHTFPTRAESPFTVDKHCDPVPGSACIVRKVYHKRTGESLAMKTYSNVFSPRQLEPILQEIAILEVCAHPNIVKLSEAFRTAENKHEIHLVFDPWAPCTLQQLFIMPEEKRKKKCPWLRPGTAESDLCVHRIMLELADALIYLHARSIKHKDLKPANILLRNEHSSASVSPLITDVGISKIQIPATHTKYDDSTYQYLAPEQHDHVSSTLQSDVWQLGCCFAELLALGRGGSAGWWQLHDSFHRDDDWRCSFTIAKDHSYFMRALDEVCLPGSFIQRRVYEVVKGMLDLRPSSRLSIGVIRSELETAIIASTRQCVSEQLEPHLRMKDLSLGS